MTIRWLPWRTLAAALTRYVACLLVVVGWSSPAHAQLVEFTSVPLPAGPGSIRGMVDAGTAQPFTGAYQYSLPVDVPSQAGLAPSLAISYSSAAGNGLLGGGWTITLPLIRRSVRGGIPKYTSADQLELVGLGGGRLIPDPGLPSRYWVEGRGKSLRVSLAGSSYEITDSDGNVYTFGSSTAGRLTSSDGTKVAEWRLQTIRTLAGTQISFSYMKDQLQLYPSSIQWGPLQAGVPVFNVGFTYEQRPDQVIGYRTGFRVDTRQRLKTLTVSAFGQTARSYGMSYFSGPGLSRLSSIQQLGKSGASGLNPLNVFYDNAGRQTLGPIGNFAGWIPGTATLTSSVNWLDLDRDGFNDIIKFNGTATCAYRRNHGNGSFGTAQNVSCPVLALSTIVVADLDGDGFLDLTSKNGSGPWPYWQVKDLAFQSSGTRPGTDWLPKTTTFVDVNGDGRADAIGIVGIDGSVDYALNTATGFGPRLHVNANASSQLSLFHPKRVMDFNRDGLIDYYCLTTNTLQLFFGKGDMTFDQRFDVPFVPRQSGSSLLQNPDKLRLTDFDNDGFTDIIEISATSFDFYRGRGDMSGFEPRVTFTNPTGSVVRQSVLDLDGNGSLDLYSMTSDSKLWFVDLAGWSGTGNGPFVHTLDGGLGAQVLVTYNSTGGLSMADAIAGEPWQQMPTAFPVVTQVAKFLGPNVPGRTITYRPSAPYWDREERVMAGFLKNTQTFIGAPTTDTLNVISYFLPGIGDYRETRGIKYSEERSDGLGHDLGSFTEQWTIHTAASLPNDPRLFVPTRLSQHTETGGLDSKATETWSEYDADARLVRQTNYGRMDLTGDEAVYEYDYVTSDDQTWVRDMVCKERLKTVDWVPVTDAFHYYGDSTSIAALCSPGKGWPREIDRYLDREDRYVKTWARSYDALGNPTVEFDGKVSTRIGYDSLSLFPTSRTIDLTTNSSLAWGVQWDSVLGRVLQVTAPDATVDVYTYDAFARLTSEAKQGLPAHVRYDYAWTGNFTGVRPKTTTWVFDGDTTELASAGQAWPTGSKWRPITRVMNGLMEPVLSSVPSAAGQYLISGYVERDARGQLVRKYESFYSTTAEPTSVVSGTRSTTATFDALGRSLVVTAGNGAQTTFSYDGMTQTVLRPDVVPVTTEFDGLGRVTHVERSVYDLGEYADYDYDEMNHLIQITLQGGAVTSTFDYDSLGRVRSASDPDSGNQSWDYDDRGFVTTHVNGASNLTRMAYDAAGRLTRKGEGPVLDDALDTIFYYDTPLNTGDARTKGRLAWVDEPDNGQLEFSYDVFGNPLSVRRVVTGAVGMRMPVFSPSGLKLRESFDDGFSITNTHDKAGRLISAGDHWVADELDAESRSVREHFGNGVSEVHTFDMLGLPDRVTVTQNTGVRILEVDIDRYASGRPSSMIDYDGIGMARGASFSYDQAGRLYWADYRGSDPNSFRYFQWWYDSLQNFQYRSAGDAFGTLANGWFNYGENGYGPRQLTSVSPWISNPMPTTFAYDGAGRQTREFDASLFYDGFDRLTRITTPPGTVGPGGQTVNVQYTYGADNLRTSMSNAQGTQERWFDSDWRESGGRRQHFISVGQRLVAQATRTNNTNKMVYFHQGLSAGPEVITNALGAVLEDRLFEPFGHVAEPSGNSSYDFVNRPMNGLNQPTDAVSGFSYHGARWYTPEVGRWLSPDPAVAVPSIGNLLSPWGLNPYQYADQDPLRYWDADGRASGKFHRYDTQEEARMRANTDAFVAQINHPLNAEHSFQILNSQDGGGYYYTKPSAGTKAHPEGDPENVDFWYDDAEVEKGDKVVEFGHSGHGVDDPASNLDVEQLKQFHGAKGTYVDTEGNVHEFTADGGDEIVGHVDGSVLRALRDYNKQQQYERDKADAESIGALFEESDRERALLMEWYELYKDPRGYAINKGEHIMKHWWEYIF